MKDKDITEKHLESFNDVFSDIINVLIFDGNNVIKENTPVHIFRKMLR